MRLALLTLALGVVVPLGTHADPKAAKLKHKSPSSAPPPELWLARPATKTTPKAVAVTSFGGATEYVSLDKPIPTTAVDVYSLANDNTRYRLWAVSAKASTPVQWPVVGLAGRWWKAESKGSDSTGDHASFTFDRATATLLAAAYQVPVHDRTRLDSGLRYAWTIPQAVTAGVPVTIKLRVENAGTTTVGLTVGGRQRGPRDNRFSFTVERDGAPVKLIDAPDFGGIMTYEKLAPGGHAELSVDLRSWAALDQPGSYAVTARYEGELSADGRMPSRPAEWAKVWDIAPISKGTILAR